MTYGYVRVSTRGQARDGNSLDVQRDMLMAAGATDIRIDVYTGKSNDRPELARLLNELKKGDSLVVTKLDRLGRSVAQLSSLLESLRDLSVCVHILNVGVIDDTPIGRMLITVLAAVAEFERDMILERCNEGRTAARQRPGYREGRPRKYTSTRYDAAEELLRTHSYTEVSRMTGIPRATLAREMRRRREQRAGDVPPSTTSES